MHTVLAYIAKKRKFDLPPEVAQEIIEDSGGNLRKAILVFEALKMQSFVSLSLPKHKIKYKMLTYPWLQCSAQTFPVH